MINKTVKHLHRFRVVFLLFFSVAFMFMVGLNPVSVGRFIGTQFGLAIGMTTGVAENPINKLALELKNKEDSLNIREKELETREMQINEPNKKQDILITFMGIGIWMLFCLIMINFYLDWKKRKALRETLSTSVRVGRSNMNYN